MTANVLEKSPARPVTRPIKNVPLACLNFSKINVRKYKSKDVSSLAATIASVGLLNPILVRLDTDGTTYEVVAGERRTLAFQNLNKAGHPDTDSIPAVILEPGDDALAIEASLAENVERLPIEMFNEMDAFLALKNKGRSVADIAHAFGISEQLVNRRLALGALIPEIKKLYRQGDLSGADVQLLTLASKEKQRAYATARQNGENVPPRWQLRAWLLGGAAIKTSVALFDLADYKAPIAHDLFGDDAYFSDAEEFWQLQNTAIAALKEQLEASGWSAIHVIDPSENYQSWNYSPLTKAKGGHVVINVSADGSVETTKGLVHNDDLRRFTKKVDKTAASEGDGENDGGDGDEADEPATTERPELSEPLANYIDLVRHSAVRAKLATTPKLALRLAVAQLAAGSTHWLIKREPRRATTDKIAAALSALPADRAFAEQRAAVIALLPQQPTEEGEDETSGDDALTASSWDHSRTGIIFAHLQTLSDADVLRLLAVVTAETLALGTEIVDALGTAMNVDVTKTWEPDDTFFELVRDKQVLNEMLIEVIGKTYAETYLTDTGTKKKTIIRKALAGDGREKVTDWQPRWMVFPASSYTDRPLTNRRKPTA